MNHVVVEGLPAVGKSEMLELLARFYPHRVRILPELVKMIVLEEGIDLFQERGRLTEAIRRALPDRRRQIQTIIKQGFLCVEESHLGVHYAYSAALGDRGFLELYPALADALPVPDAYCRMEIPVADSLDRQRARGTARFDIDGPILSKMLSELDRWHASQLAPLLRVNANRQASAVVAEMEALLNLEHRASEFPND
jgi:thymidylate kinase